MSFFKVETWKDVLMHLVVLLVLTLSIGYYILYVWLPSYTNHDQQIEVPNLERMTISEAQQALEAENLQLFVQDTVYRANYKPGVVHRQEPAANSKVKENRRIYVSVNTKKVPDVDITSAMMKGLKLQSLDVVKSKIREYGFKEGGIKREYGKYEDYVLHTIYKDDTLKVGDKIPEGSKIDIIVSDGKAN